jgi:hypothetical protein
LPNSVYVGEKGNCRYARLWGWQAEIQHYNKAKCFFAAFDLRDPASLLPDPAKEVRLSQA